MGKILNRLQLDILKKHVGPFIFCFFTVMFLLLMQFLILYIDKLIGKGLPLHVIIELIITNLAYMVVLAAPMSVLVASLMAFGKFSELNELTALRAAGINPIHTINPVLVVSAILCLVLIWFSNDVLPDANQRARSLFIDIRIKKPGFDLKPGEFYKGISGYTFLVKRMADDSDSLYDVTLFQEPSGRQNKAIIKAASGQLSSEDDGQTLSLMLHNGSVMRYLERRKNHISTSIIEKTDFDRYRIIFDLSDLAFSRSNPDQRSRSDRTMNIQTMVKVVETLKNEMQKDKDNVLTNRRYILPLKASAASMPLKRGRQEVDSSQTVFPSSFVVLQQQTDRRMQRRLRNIAVGRLRDYRSSFETLDTNLNWRQTQIARYTVEIHKKFSIPLACIIFVLIGAPIGMYTEKGNIGYAALISAGFLTFYWISIIQGEKLADRLYISPFTGMWFADIILAITGAYLTIRFCTSFKFSNLWKSRA